MPTPPLPDELLQEAVAAYRATGDKTQAAASLGMPRNTFCNRLTRAAERGFLGPQETRPGYTIASVSSKAPDGSFVRQVKEHGDVFAVPAGHTVKGVSALVDADGREVVKWIKTRNEYAAADVAEILKAAFADYVPAAWPSPHPAMVADDVLTLIPCGDWHVNLLTWGRETGENWDLKIAERVIGAGIDDAIARSPASGIAVVLSGGDLIHSDTNDNRTARSGNALDVDGRHQRGLEVACRLKVRTINAALRRNGRVIVRILKGNHDEQTAVAVAYFLLAWYRNEPRVTVDVDASLFWWLRFGKVMLGATHGHTVKLKDMAAIMAHRRPDDWGATRFRYVHGFHIHHSSKYASEGGGVISESHQAPIPQDAWHFGAGYLSGRSLQTISYHSSFGEISRVRVAILDGAQTGANDNHGLKVAA